MARARNSGTRDAADVQREIKAFYKQRLSGPANLPDWGDYEPRLIGPTWQTNPDGTWLLPERTLGWEMLGFCSYWFQLNGEDLTFTDEQARFILHLYALDETGRFLYSSGVLQRLKGWGKDPLAALIALFEMVGPCVFVEFAADGEPICTDRTDSWVQVAAVALEQTQNTMELLPGLITEAAETQFGFQIGAEKTYAGGRRQRLVGVTSSPATLEGNRPNFVLLNETGLWDRASKGHKMASVIRRNIAKSPGGQARTLAITNPPMAGEDSVAERDREAYESVVAGKTAPFGQLYDSIEAGPNSPLTADAAPKILEIVRGDSVWLDIPSIVQAILNPSSTPHESRRFYYNQMTSAPDAWLIPDDWDANAKKRVLDGREVADELADGTEIVMFGDVSKSDDATGIVACRISDGKLFQLGVWDLPRGWDESRQGVWTVDRDAVDRAVTDAFARFKPLAFFCDQSHSSKDDEGVSYWLPYMDMWHQRYKDRLKLWGIPSGERAHSIIYDMAGSHSPRLKAMIEAAQQFEADALARELPHDGSPMLAEHIKNARRVPTEFGIWISKESRGSSKKIDLAVCAIGARMVWRIYNNKFAKTKSKQRGRVLVLR